MSLPIRAVTRVTVELQGPCNIGTGATTLDSDRPFVVDANGLPAIPGTTWAGLLRAAVRRRKGGDYAARWFGGERATDDPSASRVRPTWGRVHNSDDRAVDGMLDDSELNDNLLSYLAGGEIRDHVRIGHHGAVDEDGKFDRQVVPRGARFSFDIEIAAPAAQSEDVEALRDLLLSVLAGPKTRLGASTHSGFGAFDVVRACGEIYDLQQDAGFDDYSAFPVDLSADVDAAELQWTPESVDDADIAEIPIELTPETFFAVFRNVVDDSDSAPDMAPVTTRPVTWNRSLGSPERTPNKYIPATSLKGSLSHRVAFHSNRLLGNFAGDNTDPEDVTGENNPVIRRIFGYCHDSSNGDEADSEDSGRMGTVLLEDAELPRGLRGTHQMIHISNDPFTGGVKDQVLFSEEVVEPADKTIDVTLRIESPGELREIDCHALYLALEDITSGRQTIGGGQARGHGHFSGDFDWPAEQLAFDELEEL